MIQKASLSDFDEIAALEQRSNPVPWTPSQLKGSLNEHEVIVLKQSLKPVYEFQCNGETSVDRRRPIRAFLIAQTVMDEASLLHIAVDIQHQSKGAGRKLLEWWIAQLATEISNVWLEVRESNEKAQRLYLSCGFKKIGERKEYYRNISQDKSSKKETAYIYRLSRVC